MRPLAATFFVITACRPPAARPRPEPSRAPSTTALAPPSPAPTPVVADPIELTFTAVIGKPVLLSSFTGTVIPVHRDPRFVLPVTIETAPAGDPILIPGTVVHFAIHSPSRTFAGAAPSGRTRTLTVQMLERDGTRRWSALRVGRTAPTR